MSAGFGPVSPPRLDRRPRLALPLDVAGIALLAGLAVTVASVVWAAPDEADIATPPPDLERVGASIDVPPEFQVELFAAEPMLANPVCFALDGANRVYVAETFRHTDSVTDTRRHMYWLDDDLASRSVEDRVAMYRKWHGRDFDRYTKYEDRVRLIEDVDGDHRADRATVFAGGFREAGAGIGAGLLPLDHGKVLWASIPSLWRLEDADGDRQAERREELQRGYGVHVGYLGHDLHGLVRGPDGRIYFSIGDRGLRVRTTEKLFECQDTGAVLRCEPDGSGLEIFATGLRNPQELAFDDFGNLFTCDNNSDSGDRARIVFLLEGGDCGWRIGYQFLDIPGPRGPWNDEKLWYPPFPGQAAWIVPPVANFADGPSGFAIEPGVWAEPWKSRFFLCDFRGDRNSSGVRWFELEPQGAGFELAESDRFAWRVLATDTAFGSDGALWITDWVQGWDKPRRGRIWRVVPPFENDEMRATARLLEEDFTRRDVDSLVALLANGDRRVRLRAQYALADRGEEIVPKLVELATRSSRERSELLARVHALWALGQVERAKRISLAPVRDLLSDPQAEIRAQAARLLGDSNDASVYGELVGLLEDASARVRLFALLALAKLGKPESIPAVFTVLEENADRDPWLRHAAVMSLAGTGDVDTLAAAVDHPSRAVRIGALLSLRRLERPEVARFLGDEDSLVVEEAARAIYDTPIPGALPALARVVLREKAPRIAVRRALAALSRLRSPEAAAMLAAYAATRDAPRELRLEAIDVLRAFPDPPGRDRILGTWRPIPPADRAVPRNALDEVAGEILGTGDREIVVRTAETAADLGARAARPALRRIVTDEDAASSARAAALIALERLGEADVATLASALLGSDDGRLRSAARRVLSRRSSPEAVPALVEALERGDLREKQESLAILAETPGPLADAAIARSLDGLERGEMPRELELDVRAAAAKRASPELTERLRAIDAKLADAPAVDQHAWALEGGNARRGEETFFGKVDVSCSRCHKIGDRGGEVGPPLDGIGGKRDRAYILRSILEPDGDIAEGFESVAVVTSRGRVVVGVRRGEDDQGLHLVTAEGDAITIPASEIVEKSRASSAMPADLARLLSPFELRDLVEFLATRRR